MTTSDLKSCLIKYPSPGWEIGLDYGQCSQEKFVQTLAEILRESGQFPVGRKKDDESAGLFVIGSDDQFVGHWTSIEKFEDGPEFSSIASEDLGDGNMAAYAIFRSCFSYSSSGKINDADGNDSA